MRSRLPKQMKQVFGRVPPRKQGRRYLVNYDGGMDSLAALLEACETANPDTRVVAVYLDMVPRAEALEPSLPAKAMLAEAVLAGALANARLRNYEIETLSVPCHAKGPALVALAAQYGDAVVFLGVERREFTQHLNSFAEYVLSLAPCKVVLVGV